jgi:type IV pilus assembly protein PilA
MNLTTEIPGHRDPGEAARLKGSDGVDSCLGITVPERSESGFTLIELMVVLLIIAILLAIAIPTFLGVTNTAGDRAAQSNLTNAVTEAKALYQVNQSYSTNGIAYTAGQFQSKAPEFAWTTGACSSTSTNCVSFAVFGASTLTDGQGFSLAAYSSKTSTCWYVFDLESGWAVSGGGSFPSAGVFYGKQTNKTSCTALNPDSDTHVSLTAGQGQSYATAVSVS